MSRASESIWMHPGAVTAYGLALAAGWVFYKESISPLRQQIVETGRQVVALQEKTADARGKIAEGRQVQVVQSGPKDDETDPLGSGIPAGAPLVWLPERMQQHFGRGGFSGVVTRMNSVREEKGLAGYERSFWRVSIPIPAVGGDTTRLLRAVAELDTPDSVVRVMDFTIGPDPQNPARKVAAMNVSVLLPR